MWQDKVIISDNAIKWRHDFSKHKIVSTYRRIMSLFALLFALLRRRSLSGKLMISKISIKVKEREGVSYVRFAFLQISQEKLFCADIKLSVFDFFISYN